MAGPNYFDKFPVQGTPAPTPEGTPTPIPGEPMGTPSFPNIVGEVRSGPKDQPLGPIIDPITGVAQQYNPDKLKGQGDFLLKQLERSGYGAEITAQQLIGIFNGDIVDPAFYKAVQEKLEEKGIPDYNPLEWARAAKEVRDLPWYVNLPAEIATDPLGIFGFPSKIRYGKDLSKAIPTIIGGIDWMKPVLGVKSVFGAADRTLDTFVDDFVKNAEQAEQGAKSAKSATSNLDQGFDFNLASQQADAYDPSSTLKKSVAETKDPRDTILKTKDADRPYLITKGIPKNDGVYKLLDRFEQLKTSSLDYIERAKEAKEFKRASAKAEYDTLQDAIGNKTPMQQEMFEGALQRHRSKTDGEFERMSELIVGGKYISNNQFVSAITKQFDDAITQQDYNDILKFMDDLSITQAKQKGLKNNIDEISANREAFHKMVFGEQLSQKDISRIDAIFGEDMTKTYGSFLGNVPGISSDFKGFKKPTWQQAMELIGLPRTIVASYDLSAPLRQVRKLGREHPEEFSNAFYAMHRYMSTEVGTQAVEQSIKQNPYYGIAEQAGLFFAERGAPAGSKLREEAFISNLAGELPLGIGKGVKISENAYTIFLNKFRHDVFYKQLDSWSKSGMEPTQEQIEGLARMINWGTGRGPNPFEAIFKGGGAASVAEDLLNAAFFAPRFTASGPAFIFGGAASSLSDIARGRNLEVAKFYGNALAGYINSSFQWLKFLQLAGADVEVDPRSSNFGKGSVGPHRFDFFGGDAQLIRYTTQAVSGKKKSISTDIVTDVSFQDVIGKFIQSKMSPSGGLAKDAWRGEDFLGRAFDLSTREGIREEVKNRLVPMTIQNIIEVMEGYENPWAAFQDPTASSGMVFGGYGGGYQYFNSRKDIQNLISQKVYGQMYDDLQIIDKQQIDIHPELRVFDDEMAKSRPAKSGQEAWTEGMAMIAENTKALNGIDEGYRDNSKALIPNILNAFNKQVEFNLIQLYLKERSDIYKYAVTDDAQTWAEVYRVPQQRTNGYEVLKDKYWSITALPIYINNKFTGMYDYVDLKRQREAILTKASDFGYIPKNLDGTIDRTSDGYKNITKRRPFAGPDETDPERIQFGKLLDEYYENEELLTNYYYNAEFKIHERLLTSGNENDKYIYEALLNKHILPSFAVGKKILPEGALDRLEKIEDEVEFARLQARNAGFDFKSKAGVVAGSNYTEEEKARSIEITKVLLKRGDLQFVPQSRGGAIADDLWIELKDWWSELSNNQGQLMQMLEGFAQ